MLRQEVAEELERLRLREPCVSEARLVELLDLRNENLRVRKSTSELPREGCVPHDDAVPVEIQLRGRHAVEPPEAGDADLESGERPLVDSAVARADGANRRCPEVLRQVGLG